MLVSLTRKTAPAAPPVTLTEAKAHLRVDFDDDNTLISAMIDAATATLDAEGDLGRCIKPQVWRHRFAHWYDVRCHQALRLRFPDASDVAVTYLDASGTAQTLDPALYDLIEEATGAVIRARIGSAWPSPGSFHAPITVEATHGLADDAPAMAAVRAAVLLMVGDLYRNRETTAAGQVSAVPVSITVDRLLAPHRYGLVFA